jgi:hypothetical protein
MMRVISGFLCALISAVLVLPAVAADDTKKVAGKDLKAKPSATLDVASEEMRLIFGGTKGKGVLHFKGKDYPFTFKTASAGVGAKMVMKMSATGNVYSLNRIEDFAGEYVSVAHSVMAGATTATATYKNDKGVSIDLRANVEGAGLSFGGGMATIELVKH